MDFEYSAHAREMIQERRISEEWVRRTLDSPDCREMRVDGNMHYIKAIPDHDGRFLRVVVNPIVVPNRIVTVFFDRRLRRQR